MGILQMTFSIAIRLCLVVAGLVQSACVATAGPPIGPNWIPNDRLSDEFNGTVLDSSKWRPNHAWYAGKPPSKFTSVDISVHGGILNIGASELPADQKTAKVWMSTGCISSLLPIVGPGYYEARIKASPSPLDSAFFLQVRSGQEIDIAENFGGSFTTPGLRMQARSHTHWFPKGYKRENDTDSAVPLSTPNTQWHVYAVWLQSPTKAVFFVDGNQVATHHMRGRFTQPMYMFFNQEPSVYQGIPTPADLRKPANFTMQVDWVRAYSSK